VTAPTDAAAVSTRGDAASVAAAGRRPDRALASLVLLGGAIAYAAFFYRDLLFAHRVSVFRDQYTILLAVDHIVRVLSEFDWPPLWSPFQVLGKPLAADPLSAVYYPFNWALRLLPWPLGYNASLAVHHVWAAAGMYWLLRRCALSTLAAAFGALLFAFGGLFVSFDNMINALQSAAWAPWTLLAFVVWCAEPSFVALATVAVGLTMTLLGGMPEVFFFENVFFVAIAVERHHAGVMRSWPRVATACVIANALAIGLGAVQLLPTAEYLLHSSRAAGLNAEAVMHLALRPFGVFAFVLPRHFVDPSGRFHETAALWEGDFTAAPWALTLYLGPALALLGGMGARLARFQRRWWLGIGLGSLALALGPWLPGYRWMIEHIPLLRAVRYPEKFLLVVHGLFAAGAALGLDSALRDPRRFAIVRRTALALAAVALAAAAGVSLQPSFARAALARDLVIVAVAFAVVAAIAAFGRRSPRGAALALLGLTAADLYRVNGQLLPTLDWRETVRVPGSARVMERGDDPLRIYSDGVGRPAVPSFPEGFRQEQNLLLMEVANYYGIANLNAPASINLSDHETLASLTEEVPRDQVAPLLAAFNTAYVTSPKNLQGYAGLQAILKPASPIEAYVYRVDGVAPRAFVPPALEPVTQSADAIEYLRRSTAPAARVAVARDAIPPQLPEAMAGSVRIAAYRPEDVELTASMQTDGLVVLTDSFYPGWQATVDGSAAPIVRANYFARGVFVPAGEHRIVFRYRPLSHRIGTLISLTACAVVLIGVGVSRRRRRPPRASI
jgi:hypothetical protein